MRTRKKMRALTRLWRRIFPASRLYFNATNQTKTVDGGRAFSRSGPFKPLPEEPTPFRCPGPHSPSKVEGVAGTYSMGRRLQLPQVVQDALRFSFSCIQCSYSCDPVVTTDHDDRYDRKLENGVGFSPPFAREAYPTTRPEYSRNLLTIATCSGCVNFFEAFCTKSAANRARLSPRPSKRCQTSNNAYPERCANIPPCVWHSFSSP